MFSRRLFGNSKSEGLSAIWILTARLLSVAVLFLTVRHYFLTAGDAAVQAIPHFLQYIPVPFAYVVFSYLLPILSIVASIGFLSLYLIHYGALAELIMPSLYLFAVWLVADWLSFHASKGTQENSNLDPFWERQSRTILTLLSIVCLSTFLLLGIKQLTVHFLFLSLIPFMIAGVVLYRRRRREGMPSYFISKLRSPIEDQSLQLMAIVIGLLVASGLVYFASGSICGDCVKAYDFAPRIYSIFNSLAISDPAWTTNIVSGFQNTQEMFLSAAYVLGGHLGLKLFAWILVIFKAIVFLQLASIGLGMSLRTSILALILYLSMPIVFELHGSERPENMVTVFALLAIYFLERSSAEFCAEWSLGRSFNLAGLGVFSLCLAISVKLTAIYLAPALLIVYFPIFKSMITNIRQWSVNLWLLLLASICVVSVWFVRNLILHGFLVNMTPFGKYHLTILFPPIRSFEQLNDFLRSAFVFTQRFTEFPNYGYGILGFVIFAAILWGASCSGSQQNIRRLSFFCILFMIGLLSSTNQIRYMAPIIPICVLIMTGLGRRSIKSKQGTLALPVAVIIISSAYGISMQVGSTTLVALNERLNFAAKKLDDDFAPVAAVNKVAKFPDKILTPFMDNNYLFSALSVRLDPGYSIGSLAENQKIGSTAYWANQAYDRSTLTFFYFNDPDFLETVAQLAVKESSDDPNWILRLLRYDPLQFNRLLDYVDERGWSRDRTWIGSADLVSRFPFHLFVGEELCLKGLKHRLFKLNGYWNESAKSPVVIDPSADPSSVPVAWYLEDKEVSSSGLNVQKAVISDMSGPNSFSQIRYQTRINSTGPDKLMMRIFIRSTIGDLPVPDITAVRDGVSTPVRPGRMALIGTQWIEYGAVALGDVNSLDLTANKILGAYQLRFLLFKDSAVAAGNSVRMGQCVNDDRKELTTDSVLKVLPLGELANSGSAIIDSPDHISAMVDNFSGAPQVSRGMKVKVANSIRFQRVDDQGGKNSLQVESGGEEALRTYRVKVRSEYANNLVVKAFVRGASNGEESTEYFTVAVKDPGIPENPVYGAPPDGVYMHKSIPNCGPEKSFCFIGDAPIPSLSFPRGDDSKYRHFDVELRGRKISSNIALDEFVVLVGRAPNPIDESFRPREPVVPIDGSQYIFSQNYSKERGLQRFRPTEIQTADCDSKEVPGVGKVLLPGKTMKCEIAYKFDIPNEKDRQLAIELSGRAYTQRDKISLQLNGANHSVSKELSDFDSKEGEREVRLSLAEFEAKGSRSLVLKIGLNADAFSDRTFLRRISVRALN